MKIRERREITQGFGGPHWQDRVRELAAGDAVPEGAETVPDETRSHDWQPEVLTENERAGV